MAKIYFRYRDTNRKLRRSKRIKLFLEQIFQAEGIRIDVLSVVFSSDAVLLDLNRKFLKHDFLTDILTFPLHDAGKPVQAEIYISMDRVKSNAITYNFSWSHELLRVIFHGVLHLCGYKDKSKTQRTVMRTKENFYLASYYSVPHGTVSV